MRLSRSSAAILITTVFVIIATILEIYFIQLPTLSIVTRLILVALLSINFLALLILVFLVAKNLFKLYVERKNRVLGYRFRTRLMTIFVILTLIPAAFLFFAASGLASNYINRFFSPQLKEPLKLSIEFARAVYDFERERVLSVGRRVSEGETGTSGGLSVIRHETLPPNASETLRDAFQGIEGTEVVSGETGDIIRAAVPDRRRGGVVVTELILPKEITQKIEHLERLHEEHLKLAAFKAPLKLNYILILGFLTLMMVFTALWVSLKVSKGITTPIQSLAMATEQVAGGDLDVSVSATSEDEVGILISSFNQMVRQLKENKQSLENAYTESDKRRLYLENILQSITSGVLFLDHSGRIQAVNRAACSILSMSQEDVTGKDYKTLIGHLNSEDLKQLVRNLEGSEIRDISREIKVNRGGRIIILRVRIAGIRETPESSALGMLVVFDDLTDIIKAQKAMAWQEVARRMAHEIKNPLTPIKLSTERLIRKWKQKESDFDAVFEKSTKTIITEVEGLRRLVDVFSKYGRMPEAQKVPTDMGELLDGVSQLYKGFADVTIGLHIEESLPEIPVDREQFKRVFINIVDNAVKAMNEQGSIDITAKSSGRYLVIEIADTGPGIPDEEKEKLFIPYFSKRRDGTGLGLAIADKIVTDHGGRVLVSDNVPRGSVFTIEIPF